jgi:hypothetical protein
MKIGNAFLIVGVILAGAAAAAQPGPRNNPSAREVGISCRDFRMNSDGSWTPIRKVTLLGPNGPFTVSQTRFLGFNSKALQIMASK